MYLYKFIYKSLLDISQVHTQRPQVSSPIRIVLGGIHRQHLVVLPPLPLLQAFHYHRGVFPEEKQLYFMSTYLYSDRICICLAAVHTWTTSERRPVLPYWPRAARSTAARCANLKTTKIIYKFSTFTALLQHLDLLNDCH